VDKPGGKVLFICNSFENGRDGVGDYTRKLAAECTKYGLSPVVIAFSDRYVTRFEEGNIDSIKYYRVPADTSLMQKEQYVAEVMQKNGPFEWASVQFVSYGLNSKGIVKPVIEPFKRLLKGVKVHVMLHELWIGEEKQAPLKMKIIGRIQKRYILRFLKAINARVIQTSIPLYKKMLGNEGISASVLPLISNIENYHTSAEEFKDEVPVDIYIERDKYIIGCLFGSVYDDNWNLDSLLTSLQQEQKRTGKKAIIASIGKISSGKEFWLSLPSKYHDIRFITLGEKQERFISYWLTHFADFGIVTTPLVMTGKSGSYMAFLEHGVPAVCNKNTRSFKFGVTDELIDSRILQIENEHSFQHLRRIPPIVQLKSVTESFVNALNL